MLKIIYSKTNKDSAEFILRSLKGRDKTQKHIVFTPDRANLIYQNSIFDLIDEECLFDVDITTISRFASRFSDSDKVLSKQGGVSIVKKILLQHEKDFLTFGKSVKYKGFALSIFETLCMFKSCKIGPEDIATTSNTSLNNKLHDIKIVYEDYERFLQNDYTDAFNILSLCASKIDKSFKDTNFYFIGFEDFTRQGLFLIQKMMQNAKDVYVGVTYGKKGKDNNYNLYDNYIISSLLDIAKVNGVKFDLINAKSHSDELHSVLKENLFSYSPKYTANNENIRVLSYENKKDEVEATINFVRYLIQKNNLKYSDFTILVPGLASYKKELKESFKKFDIPYYLDESQCFAEHIIARYVLALIKIVDNYNEIFSLINTPFIEIPQDKTSLFLDRVEKYGIKGKKLLDCEELACDDVIQIASYIDSTKKEKTFDGYITQLSSVLESLLYTKIQSYEEKLYSNGLIEEYKKIPQCIDVMQKTLSQLKEILGDYECPHKEFEEIFENYINNINLTLPPIVLDNVFVGEIETSFVQNTKYLFVLGCNDGVVPAYNADLGLLSDREIDLMPQNYKLNPTIAQINKRKKLKVFENLLSFKDKLYVSYLTSIDGGKAFASSFVEDIMTLFGIESTDLSAWLNCAYLNEDSQSYGFIEFANLNQKCVDYNFAKQLKNYPFLKDNLNYSKYLTLLNNFADSKIGDNYNFNNDIACIDKGLFLSNGEIGVSEIERFNSCPYKHFVEYGLKIRDKQHSDFQAIDNGQIIHEFLRFVVHKIEKGKTIDVKELTRKVLHNVVNKEQYAHLVENPENKANVKSLYNECVRIVEAIKYQLDNSDFIPFKLEQPFRHSVSGLSVDGKDVMLVGVVDRIDKWNDCFSIIDYKTGSSKMDNFDEVASGEKWQLIVYTYVASSDKLKPAGCFYMPIKNDFTSKEKHSYQLQGVLNKDRQIISAFDNNLDNLNVQSKIIKLATNDKGLKENSYFKNMCLSDTEISKLCDWVMKNVENRITEIINGVVVPYPLNSGGRTACDYCKYIGLCNFNKMYGNKYNNASKCKNLSQLLGEVENE